MVRFCSLFSGSSGNALYLSSGNTSILIDCGLSASKVAKALFSIGADPYKIDALVITHEHSDHIRGAAAFSKKYGVPVFTNEATWEQIAPLFGQRGHERCTLFGSGHFEIRDIGVHPFSIPHDAAEPVGYRFFAKGKKLAVATDMGRITSEIGRALHGSDFVLIESNHDVEMLLKGRYPHFLKRRILGDKGHLSNAQAGKLAAALARCGTERFMLGHLSRENNLPEIAYQTVAQSLACQNTVPGRDVTLDVAMRDEIGKVIVL